MQGGGQSHGLGVRRGAPPPPSQGHQGELGSQAIGCAGGRGPPVPTHVDRALALAVSHSGQGQIFTQLCKGKQGLCGWIAELAPGWGDLERGFPGIPAGALEGPAWMGLWLARSQGIFLGSLVGPIALRPESRTQPNGSCRPARLAPNVALAPARRGPSGSRPRWRIRLQRISWLHSPSRHPASSWSHMASCSGAVIPHPEISG